MHQYFILVLVTIVTVLNFKMKMVILCILLFLLVTRPVGIICQSVFINDHECQVAKGMRWGILIGKRGARGSSSEKIFIILEVHDHWFFNHKE